jgi:hypothetical protein
MKLDQEKELNATTVALVVARKSVEQRISERSRSSCTLSNLAAKWKLS